MGVERDLGTDRIEPLSRHLRAAAHDDAGLVLVYASSYARFTPVLRLEREHTFVGREPPAGGFAIDDSSVSRVHAQLVRTKDGFLIRDLGSRNGVIVDGKVAREATLTHGAIVRIGNVLFRFVGSGSAAYADFARDGGGASTLGGAVGGPSIARVAKEVADVARTSLSILVLGETGTGKELVARGVHEASGREGQFGVLNCAALPANLIESELFGHTRGAYTGADRERIGYVRRAHRGTLMLDEIGDMPLEAQAKLLRLLETREVIPVGAETPIEVDVRFVCATHRDLRADVAAGRFRGDLFARINGSTIRLPPLRDRKEDLLVLLQHFWRANGGEPPLDFELPFFVALAHHDWPYNVRELQAVVQRAIAMAGGARLGLAHLPPELRDALDGYGEPLETDLESTETAPQTPRGSGRDAPPTRAELLALASSHRGNLAAIGRAIGKDRAQVHRWLKQHAIDPESFRTK